MGEMADMALDRACYEEELADEYVQGGMSMEDAFEHGFLDASGAEVNMESAWERSPIPTPEALGHQLEVAELQLQVSGTTEHYSKGEVHELPQYKQLNLQAKRNLLRPAPTCNVCGIMMADRMGMYGKFYYCSCEDQKCVSDKYWQSIRRV